MRMKQMARRGVYSFVGFLILTYLVILRVYSIASGPQLAETAQQQSTYRLELAQTRGTFYDCAMRPLTGEEQSVVAAVAPVTEAAAALAEILTSGGMAEVYPMLTKGVPFSLSLPELCASSPGIDVFQIDKRYQDQQTAACVLGYLNGDGTGAAGLERAFNEYLTEDAGEIAVSYKVDATGRILSGEGRRIDDTYYKKQRGVVLTIDKQIQQKAEKLAGKYLKKGAVVVLEVPSGAIRAMVSVPTFSPNDVAASLTGEDSPMMNRALSAYNVGSVFKLVSAAAALENGHSPDEVYECNGGIPVTGSLFRCFNGIAHGEVDMKEAIAQSCNAYFIHLMQSVPASEFLDMAEKLGFGRSTVLAPDYASAPGTLPESEELQNARALANFSFGQGSLTATPLQIAGLINAVASGGRYSEPYLVEALVDSSGNLTYQRESQEGTQAFGDETARLLQEFMEASVDHGTGEKGEPRIGGAGAKTGTAQTGVFRDGEEIEQSWYAGFYPYGDPKYVIVVFGEDGEGGGSTCAPVFRELADWMAEQTIRAMDG